MKVKFSGSIASLFEGQRELEWKGHSTRALFSELQQRYPKLSETLFLPSGELRPFIRMFINGRVSTAETALLPSDEVEIISAIAGG